MVAIDELDTILGGFSKGKTGPFVYGLMDEGPSTWTSARGIASFPDNCVISGFDCVFFRIIASFQASIASFSG